MINLKKATLGVLLSFVFLTIFVYTISGIQLAFGDTLKNGMFLASISGSVLEEQEPAPKITPRSDPELIINAEGAISLEASFSPGAQDKIIFEKNSSLQMPIASLTKLMTAIIVLDNYDLSETIMVSETANSQDPMKQDVNLGDALPVQTLLEIMLVGSSNKSAYALAEKMGVPQFVDLMNRKAKEIGLDSTFFEDPTGLSAKNVSTAADLARLAKHILENYYAIAKITRAEELDAPGIGKFTNTNQILEEFPAAVCSKTGFTTDAKGCLLLALSNPKNNSYLINVILGADSRFFEMEKLINWQNTCSK